MRYVQLMECRVKPGMMTDFVRAVQGWEAAALDRDDAPDYHAVLLREDDPAHAVILTQFTDRNKAESFAAGGELERFVDGIFHCVGEPPTRTTYDLFYASGEGGLNSVFGQDGNS